MSTHSAAVLLSPGQPLAIHSRATPKPGPNDLLIAVKSIALNPADLIIRDDAVGQFIAPARYKPAPDPSAGTNSDKNGEIILGFDLSGLVLKVGAEVPSTAGFQSGKTRIAAYSVSFWRSWDPDYGAFQQYCLVPWQHCIIIPDNISFNAGASIPVALCVALNAWEMLDLTLPRSLTHNDLDDGVAIDAKHDIGAAGASSKARPTCSDGDTDKQIVSDKSKTREKEAILVWGASSSVGTMGVQIAALLRTHGRIAAIYATAGEANMDYIISLGADRVWNYKGANLPERISAAAKEDGLVIRRIFLAKGSLGMCCEVLELCSAEIHEGDVPVPVCCKIASAPPIAVEEGPNRVSERRQNVETVFIMPSMDEETRLGQFRSWTGPWLTQNLAKGTIRPSPRVKVIGAGLEAINVGMEILKAGVSCCKLVVAVD